MSELTKLNNEYIKPINRQIREKKVELVIKTTPTKKSTEPE